MFDPHVANNTTADLSSANILCGVKHFWEYGQLIFADWTNWEILGPTLAIFGCCFAPVDFGRSTPAIYIYHNRKSGYFGSEGIPLYSTRISSLISLLLFSHF